MENLSQLMRETMPAGIFSLLTGVGELSEARGQRVCLVGGAVRDLLLGRHNLDLDLVVEGDALELATELSNQEKVSGVEEETLPGQLTLHHRFGTAKFRREDLTIDLAMARSETYARPGALPAVEPGKIEDDLRRRDFTINAMAVLLTPASFGQLLDPHGGRDDLDRGLVRILHDGSFTDDATRMLRAVRYEQRLGFELEQDTERLLRANLSSLDTVSGERIRRELELILAEEYPEKALERMQGLGMLRQLAPYIEFDSRVIERFREARRQKQTDPVLYMLLLIYPLDEDDIERFIGRLGIAGQLEKAMRQIPGIKAELPYLDDTRLAPSAAYRLLSRYYIEAIVAVMLSCDSEAISYNIGEYMDGYRYVDSALSGTDLQGLGVSPGPRMGRMLETLRDAKLDGQVRSREDEEALVRRLLGETQE